jgi:phosphopantothenoylcysteine synthetase/decarboxylase
MSTNQVTTATNLTSPDTSIAQNDARRYYNNFYSPQFSVGPANDAIVGFFEQYTQNKASAKNLAAVVIYTAQAQNLDPLRVLSDFQQLPKGQLNTYLAAFLNTNRAPTSVIGIKSTNNTNPLILRSVLV